MLGASALGRPRGMVWGGRRVQDGEHMYTCGGFILIFGKTNYVKFKNKIKLKKKKRKGREPEIKLPTSTGSLKKQESFRKTFTSALLTMPNAFDCVDHNKLWKILQELGIPDHLIWLLRNLYAGQEATIRTRHGTMDWFKIRKEVHQGGILSPCLFNLYAEYIMRNAGLDEAQAGKIAGRKSITSDMQMTPPLYQKEKRN